MPVVAPYTKFSPLSDMVWLLRWVNSAESFRSSQTTAWVKNVLQQSHTVMGKSKYSTSSDPAHKIFRDE